jgi:hypothetical protein
MRYLLENETDHALSIYPQRVASGSALGRIGVDKSADGDQVVDGWLHTTSPVAGWVRLEKGALLTDHGDGGPVEPPPLPSKFITHIIHTYSDGSVTVDGNPYA